MICTNMFFDVYEIEHATYSINVNENIIVLLYFLPINLLSIYIAIRYVKYHFIT